MLITLAMRPRLMTLQLSHTYDEVDGPKGKPRHRRILTHRQYHRTPFHKYMYRKA
jgi:hypothetical protein